MSTESRAEGASASQTGGGMSQSAADLAAEEIIELPPELSPFRRAFRRFLAHKLALAGFICLIIMALLAATQAIVSPFDPEKPHLFKVNRPPDTVNWMGTDQVGRDVFARILQGARVSLSVGIVAVSIYVVIGFIIGSIAGLAGGYVDDALMRFTDFVMTFPTFILIIILAGITGPNIFNIMVIIGIFGWPGLARLFRGNILVMREPGIRDGVERAGRQSALHHHAAHPAKHRRSRDGGDHPGRGWCDSGRGGAELPRIRRHGARRELGIHDQQRARHCFPGRLPLAVDRPGAPRSASRFFRSTSWVTACATPSTCADAASPGE